MIEEIDAWLKSKQDYQQGVRLYVRYGNIGMLKDLFMKRSRPNEMLMEKLVKVLTAIGNYESVISNQQSEPPAKKKGKVIALKYPADISNEQYTKRREAVLLLFKEQSALHASLSLIDDEKKREGICLKILELDGIISAGWDELDYYRENGKFPEKKAEKQMTVQDKIKRRNNLRTYISREKNEERKEKFLKELETLETELAT